MHFTTVLALAAAGLAGQAVAGPHHHHNQHGVRHVHEKRALVTELVTVTNWVTVTVTGHSPTGRRQHYSNTRKAKKVKPTPSSEAAPPPPPPPPPASVAPAPEPTTVITRVRPVDPAPTPAPAPAEPSKSEPAPPPPPAPVVVSSQAPAVVEKPEPVPAPGPGPVPVPAPAPAPKGQRLGAGLAYNNPNLLQTFLGSGTKIGWTYNWGQRDDSGTGLPFIPTLWGLKLDFPQVWPANAQRAIDAGSPCLFSFNEPDHGTQANLSPELAAAKHKELMNPFQGKARIGSPSITNSGASNQGIEWMKQFFAACNGGCAVDFVNIHIYGFNVEQFLAHLVKVNELFKKPVWITEFGFDGSDDEIARQLKAITDAIDNDPKYAFVEAYSYFMVEEGIMVKGNQPSRYGRTFAYGGDS